MVNSTFVADLKKEQVFGEFLDKVYSLYLPHLNIKRITNSERQRQGIDLEVSFLRNDFKITRNVDEKAQLSYINKSLPTFAFEISYLYMNQEKKGWLFDSSKLTEVYFLFTSIYIEGEELKDSKQIKSCKLYKVPRWSFINYLNKIGLNEDVCQEYSDQLRKSNQQKIIINDYMNIQITRGLAEQPVNLVIRLDRLSNEMEVVKKIDCSAFN